MLNQKPAFFAKNVSLIFVILFVFGCAAIQRPQGGPRDLTPPKLAKATPPNMTRNFNAKEVTLEFDEFFKLTNTYQEITMSPTPEKPPEYNANRKTLQIKFKDTLMKNTTYVINFGKAIQDVNESNVLKNFTYVFSTGQHIDSLSMSGTVVNSTTQEREKDATVMIFPLSQDSVYFGKRKPSIFTTTDSSGNFSLNNLHEGSYRIYALKESSPNKIFDNDKELIAFSKKPIVLSKDTSNIRLALFNQVPDKFRVEKKFGNDGVLSLLFNKRLANPSVKVIYPAALNDEKIVELSKNKDTATVYMRNMNWDSLRVAVYDGNKPLDTVYQRKQLKESFVRNLGFKYGINRDNRLKPGSDLSITATLPIASYEQGLMILKEDSTTIQNFTITKDTASTRTVYLKYRFRPGRKYQLLLNEAAFTDIYGDKNKRTAVNFEGDKQENYSQLTLKVTVPEQGKSYVVELLDDQKNLLRSDPITGNTSIVYKNYLTGKYRIRVVYDNNKNGRWDSGNVRQKQQPENIWVYDKELLLRPNWESEEPLAIPKEQINP
ncbi:Ig-like domain-containing protein [Mucilaginibacter sp. 21P]|uniref:Ig-like domain-containing protein n=1 Tax=Mucilaginibacter sp. 21P TaxID=2778902 RepID=UPI001C598289|nr:Ig-like domain-containing protein [Mucilaginibacter sp. 21P]QXV66141.1 Ig-like domain-containing protein [Mucilaginibacter sp. 21P]